MSKLEQEDRMKTRPTFLFINKARLDNGIGRNGQQCNRSDI